MGVKTKLTETSSDNLEIGILQFYSGGPIVYFKFIVFQGFRGVPSFFQGGGGVDIFSGVGVN